MSIGSGIAWAGFWVGSGVFGGCYVIAVVLTR